MGYGIIVSSDDATLRGQLASDPQAAVDDLIGVLGVDNYPGPSRQSFTRGAWQRAGSLHSSTLAAIKLTIDKATILDSPVIDPGAAYMADVLDHHAMFQLARDVEQRPHAHMAELMALQSGGDPYAVAHGPDLTAQTTRSLWYVHADSLPWNPSDAAAAELAANLQLALASRQHSEVTVRSHASALTRVGGLLGGDADDYAVVYWSGNRAATWQRLTEPERSRLVRLA